MTDTKPCEYCHTPIHRADYRPNAWKQVKTHRHCAPKWKAQHKKKKRQAKEKRRCDIDTTHIEPYLRMAWTRAA